MSINGYVLPSIKGFYDLFAEIGKTFLDSSTFYMINNQTPAYFVQAFLHNPFYGYLAPGFGIFIARILNLNTIWMLWLGRICNLVLYASITSLAIKKTPILKVPMFFMALIPLAMFQGSSVSIDALINSLGFYTIAYALYLIKSPENSIESKELIIFSIIILL